MLNTSASNAPALKWIAPAGHIIGKLNPCLVTPTPGKRPRPLVEKQNAINSKIPDHDYCLTYKRNIDKVSSAENVDNFAATMTKRKKISNISGHEIIAKSCKHASVQTASELMSASPREKMLQLKINELQKEKNASTKPSETASSQEKVLQLKINELKKEKSILAKQIQKLESKSPTDNEIFDDFLAIAGKYLPQETVILVKGQASIYHKKPRGRRYSEEFKEFCNNIFVNDQKFYKSFAALFSLPSRTTLSRQKS